MPKGVDWFSAHVALTDDYLERVDYQALIAGDENDVPSKVTQDNADKLVQGLLTHWHYQYGFKDNVNLINAEAFKYSVGVGRGRYVKKRVFAHTNKGVKYKESMMPMLVPRSIKNTYLDDTCHNLNNEGYETAPAQIFTHKIMCRDLQVASKRGSTDVNDPQGGWIKNALKGWDESEEVEVVEWEGDMVCSRRTTGSLYLANAIISVAMGSKNAKSAQVIYRVRKNPLPYSSYILFPYFSEHIDTPYATSPLMKGRPLQAAQTESLNRLMELAALNAQPPVTADRDSGSDTPIIPGARWDETAKAVQIGDPQALLAVYSALGVEYADVTGTNSARLGRQTKSHTTAYAKGSEEARGQVRIMSYTDKTLENPLERWLNMEYEMGYRNMGEEMFYIRPYRGFVKVRKDLMPEHVFFEAHGASAPADENIRFQKRMAALQQALQMDQLNVAMGGQPTIDIKAAIEQTLMEGGWIDLDAVTRSQGIAPQAAGGPGMAQGAGLDQGLQSTALQALAFGGG